MPDFNKVILAGCIGNDPDLKQTINGRPFVRLSLATHSFYEGKEKKTNWHRVMVFGPQAQLCSSYLRKGSPILIEGTLECYSYKDDESKQRTTVQIVAQKIQFLGGRLMTEVEADDKDNKLVGEIIESEVQEVG